MIYDCVIIGSGVAGLTSALYLARANKKVMIIENSMLGGTTATLDVIENYPGFISISGSELVQNIIKQVTLLGVSIDFVQIKSIDFDKKIITSDNLSIKYRTLIIASGTSSKRLNLSEEQDYIFKGLSYCAVCDGFLFKDKKIVVVTNGNSGENSINYLKNITNNIIVVDVLNNYKNENFKVYHNAKINRINGNGFVESVDIQSNGILHSINCSGLFVSLGKETDLSLYENKLNNDGKYLLSDEHMHTNIEGVFVAGDIRKKSLRQIITACADGAIAATEAIKLL